MCPEDQHTPHPHPGTVTGNTIRDRAREQLLDDALADRADATSARDVDCLPIDHPLTRRALRVVSLLCRIEDGHEFIQQFSRGEVRAGVLRQSILLGSGWTIQVQGDRVERVDAPDASPLFERREIEQLGEDSPERHFLDRWRASLWLSEHPWPISMPGNLSEQELRELHEGAAANVSPATHQPNEPVQQRDGIQ